MAVKENAYLSLDERAYRELRDMIVQGDLEPGQQIVQEALAERLGISRTPLRKAIATLAQENFLEMDARGVAYVRSFGDEEMASVWEIRAVLEGLVCRLAASRVQPQHVAYLRSLITSAAEQITDRDWTAYRKADVHFHSYLAEVADDPLVSKMLDAFQILSLTLAQGLLRSPEETLPEHLEIIDALAHGDADRAERAMLNHIRTSIAHVKTSRIEANGLSATTLREAAADRVAALASVLQETVLVACVEGGEAVVASFQEGPRVLRIAPDPDAALPLHATAAGKALLAFESEEDADRLLGEADLEAFTPGTITDRGALRAELETIRERGYAVEDEEHEVGVRGLAVPVRRHDRAVAVVAVLAPSVRLDLGACEAEVAKLTQCADAVAARL